MIEEDLNLKVISQSIIMKYIISSTFFLLIVSIFSCSNSTWKNLFFEHKHQFQEMQMLITQNYPDISIDLTRESSQFLPYGSYLTKTLSSNEGLYIRGKTLVNKEDMGIFNDMVLRGKLKRIDLFDKNCIFFMTNLQSSVLFNKHHYIAYITNDIYLKEIDFDLIHVEKLASNWYYIVRRTSIAAS